jgi:outer membrane protein assembly factor BamD
VRHWLVIPALCALVVLGGAGCGGGKRPLPVVGSMDVDKFLYEGGADALKRKKWLEAREYFRRLIDTYPRSPYRVDAKLGIGDSYLGEGRSDSLVLAANEFREFLTLAPLSERADYAQYRLAYSQVRQMLGPQRDQTATREALRELERFRQNYPKSKLAPEADALYRQARDRLSDHEYQVGVFHFRNRLYIGALARFVKVMDEDPAYTRKDALLFYLGETYSRILRPAEAKAMYELLLKDYPKSKYVKEARKRLAVSAAPPAPPVKKEKTSGVFSTR